MTTNQTIRPAITPGIRLAMTFSRRSTGAADRVVTVGPARSLSSRSLEKVVAAGLGKIGHGPRREVARCRSGKSRGVEHQVGLIKIPVFRGQRSRRRR